MTMRTRTCCGLSLIALGGVAAACPPETCCNAQRDQAECINVDTDHEQAQVFLGSFSSSLLSEEPAALYLVRMPSAAPPTEESHSVEVFVSDDGTVKVIRDGKEVSADRFERDGDMLRIVDEDGNVTEEFQLAIDFQDGDDENHAIAWMGKAAEHPPVMLGITMGEPDEALRAHLGLGDRPAIMVERVIEGLPASKAGLKPYDIIIGIDGTDDEISPELLQDVLMGKKPGDELRLHIVRGGKRGTVSVKLTAYDAKALGVASAPQAEVHEFVKELSGRRAPAEIEIEAMLEGLEGKAVNKEKIKEIERKIKEMLEGARRDEVPDRRELDGQWVVEGPDGRMRMFVMPRVMPDIHIPGEWQDRIERAVPERERLERRIAELEDRVEELSQRLEDRMEKVIHRFEEMIDRLERRMDDDGG